MRNLNSGGLAEYWKVIEAHDVLQVPWMFMYIYIRVYIYT